MARFTRMQVLTAIYDISVVPVFYHPDLETARNVVAAISRGGCKLVEFVNRGDHAFEIFSELDRHFMKADPTLILGVGSFPQDELEARFEPLRHALDLPFLCANPDRVVVSAGRTVFGAGRLAEAFAEEGGQVRWFGKPDPAAFRIAERQLQARGAQNILFVGDSLVTDVPGALAARIDTLWLAATGIHRQALGVPFNGELDADKVQALLDGYAVRPHFAAPGLV